MKKYTGVLSACLLVCLLSGCATPSPEAPDAAELDQALAVQLGLLDGLLTEQERARAMAFLARIWPLRTERLAEGIYEKSDQERRMLEQLNRLYNRYTTKYLGEAPQWSSDIPAERTLARYRIVDGTLRLANQDGGTPSQAYEALWNKITRILPEHAFSGFTHFTVFTDGPSELLAYVIMTDRQGETWEIAVDPADAGDGDLFLETVLHEYCHYLTLNAGQVTYTERQTTDTYNESGMVSRPGSYLDDFYQAFWTDVLDDRLASDSYSFFLRHEDDFVTDYAATDPSEDIAESFTYFVLYDPQEGEDIWIQKLNFFSDYPELVRLRDEIRACLDGSA